MPLLCYVRLSYLSYQPRELPTQGVNNVTNMVSVLQTVSKAFTKSRKFASKRFFHNFFLNQRDFMHQVSLIEVSTPGTAQVQGDNA